MQHQNYIAKILILPILNGNINKPFWHYIKVYKKDQAGICSLHTTNTVATTPNKKAKVLNNAFQFVFTTDDQSSLPTLPVSTHSSLSEISTTKQCLHGIFTLLSQINPHKACRPDNIPAQVLKSLDISELPPDWKTAHVTPTFKKNKISDLSKY